MLKNKHSIEAHFLFITSNNFLFQEKFVPILQCRIRFCENNILSYWVWFVTGFSKLSSPTSFYPSKNVFMSIVSCRILYNSLFFSHYLKASSSISIWREFYRALLELQHYYIIVRTSFSYNFLYVHIEGGDPRTMILLAWGRQKSIPILRSTLLRCYFFMRSNEQLDMISEFISLK